MDSPKSMYTSHWCSEGERNLNSANFSHEILVDGECVSLDYVLLKTKIYEDAILLQCYKCTEYDDIFLCCID